MFIKHVSHHIKKLGKRLLPSHFDGWLRIYPTLECNLRCSYCVHSHNEQESKVHSYSNVSWEQWAGFINEAGRNVIITGGEPFLYQGLIELINAVRPEIKVKLYTNFSQPVEEFVSKCQRPVVFFASYHPGAGPVEKFLATVEKVRSYKQFRGTIHMVGWEKQLDALKKIRKEFQRKKWFVYIDQDQYSLSSSCSMSFRQNVRCTRRIYLIAPDGNRYHCVSRMLRRKCALGNVFQEGLGPAKVTIECPDYGFCNPCDSLGETYIVKQL